MKNKHQQQWERLLLWQLLAKNNVVATLHYLQGRSLASIAFMLCVLGCWVSPAQAEGSKEMTANTGDRPFLEYSSGTNAGIQRRTIIKVYVQAGETLNLGSSAIGIGSGAINYRKPNNTTGSCPAPGSNNTGKIENRTQEVAGPLPNSGGYRPCVVTAGSGEAGVWEINFVSPNPSGSPGNTGSPNPTPIAANAAWSPQASDQPFVTAWDVTVRGANGNPITGRAFAKYLSLNMGGNSKYLRSKVTVLTRDGYQYAIDANGLDPFGFIFYADDLGFTDTSGNSLYRSIQLSGANPGTIPSGVAPPNPGANDSITDKTHKIFFNSPDSLMPGSATTPTGTTWLYGTPTTPPTPSVLTFSGIDNTPGQAGTGLGGNFKFNASKDGPYQVVIDANQNNTLGDGNDRVLVGKAVAGSNSVFWDGKDGNGNPVPAGPNFYRISVTLFAGEVHFPLIDAESNLTGVIFKRLNNPSPATTPTPDPYEVFFDDRADPAFTGTPLSNTRSPLNGLTGVIDSTGAHDYDTDFGNIRGIDTWAYYPSQPVDLSGGVTIAEADLAITKTHSPNQIHPGGTFTYTITVTNNSSNTFANSALVEDTFNSAITNISWTCTITVAGSGSGTSNCASASGTGNISSRVSLSPGGVATFTVTATLDANYFANSLSNTVRVSRSYDAFDPNLSNNTATDLATVVKPRVRLVKRITAVNSTTFTNIINDPNDPNDDPTLKWATNYLQGLIQTNAQPSDIVEYTIYFLSDGIGDATGVKICDLIPANTTFMPQAFNGLTPRDGGLAADSGIALAIGSTTPTNYLTNISDSDRGQFFTAGTTLPMACTGTNNNGSVVVDVVRSPTLLPKATSAGNPTNSYGFIRFRVRVN